MAKVPPTYVGIDVSKARLDIALCPSGTWSVSPMTKLGSTTWSSSFVQSNPF
jgi:hypothetical protein